MKNLPIHIFAVRKTCMHFHIIGPGLTLRQNKLVLRASRGKGHHKNLTINQKVGLTVYIIHNENSQSQLCFQEGNNQSQPCFQEGCISFTASFSVYKHCL